jgi:hypothetical protein
MKNGKRTFVGLSGYDETSYNKAFDKEKECKADYERKTLALCELPQDFSGVLVVRHAFRNGSITGTIMKNDSHTEIKDPWKRLSDLR